jgi:hypothetical protein
MDCAAAQRCGRQCAALRQHAAVRAAVCGSDAHGSVRAVRAAVCGSTLGSVLYGSARGSVRLSGSAALCGIIVRQSVAVRHCALVQAAVCGSAHGSVWQCVAVRYECM